METCNVDGLEIAYGFVSVDEPDKGKLYPCIDNMLALLLLKEVVFLNSHWREKEWPEKAREQPAICASCNDVFSWGLADSEVVSYYEIETVFEHWLKDPKWGTAVWCIKKREKLPQPSVYFEIQKGGIWDLEKLPFLAEAKGLDASA